METRASPWALRLAAWLWGLAGFVFALGPALVALLLWWQYRSLRKQGYRVASIAELVDPTGELDLSPYVGEFERAEAWVLGIAGWVLPFVAVLYLAVAIMLVVVYLLLCRYTALGSNGARIAATVLAGCSSLIALGVWQFFLGLAWLPLDALWANHLGLVLVTLHVAGIVLVWLPASNAYVRSGRAAPLRIPASPAPSDPAAIP